MATAENAKLQYEAGQTAYAMAALTDSGDKTTFVGTASPWSGRSGYEPDVRPDGVISGCAITPNGNNSITVAIGTAYIGGQLVSVQAGNVAVPSATDDSDTHIVYSIVVGTDGTPSAEAGASHTSFDVRSEDGGAPLVPVGDIELGQVSLTARGTVAVTAAMISQVPGTSQERFDVPLHVETDTYLGRVTFGDAMDAIHAGATPTTKKVYASYAVPSFSNIPKVKDFVAPENTRSVSSEQIYGGTVGSSSQSLGQGSFVAFLDNGITDPLVALKNENLWFKFYPDRAKSAHLMAQGYLGVARTFPAGAQIQASCTISAEAAAQEIA